MRDPFANRFAATGTSANLIIGVDGQSAMRVTNKAARGFTMSVSGHGGEGHDAKGSKEDEYLFHRSNGIIRDPFDGGSFGLIQRTDTFL